VGILLRAVFRLPLRLGAMARMNRGNVSEATFEVGRP
jgi:hypothetical protein